MPPVAKTKGAVQKPAKTVKRVAKPAPPPVKPKLPAIAVKPKKAGPPSLPLPPPPPPPAHRAELVAPRDIGRLLRYGEQFGPHKIDVRMLPIQLAAASGGLAIADPAAPRSWRVFDRPVPPGQFRVMLSVARSGNKERLAAVVIHVGRPPIERWTVAHYKGEKPPKSADELPRLEATSGWIVLIDAGAGSPGSIALPPTNGVQPIEIPLTDGRRALALPAGTGDFAAYWAVDATDKPVCLVIDFEVFSQKDWKSKPT